MKIIDIVIILFIAAIVTLIICYLIKNKGNACSSCPYHKNCQKNKCHKN